MLSTLCWTITSPHYVEVGTITVLRTGCKTFGNGQRGIMSLLPKMSAQFGPVTARPPGKKDILILLLPTVQTLNASPGPSPAPAGPLCAPLPIPPAPGTAPAELLCAPLPTPPAPSLAPAGPLCAHLPIPHAPGQAPVGLLCAPPAHAFCTWSSYCWTPARLSAQAPGGQLRWRQLDSKQ